MKSGLNVRNYYDILGIPKSASESDIKKAYRKLAMEYHPDRNQGNKAAEEKFKEINEAYAVLSDGQKKQQYDAFGDQRFHQQYSSDDIFRGTDFGSIFEELGLGGKGSFFSSFFGGGAGGGFPPGRGPGYNGPVKGQDIEYPLSVGFMEAYAGADRRIHFSLSDGTQRELTIKIPKGVRSGAKLRVSGRGAASRAGGPPGDLFIQISVAEHPQFKRVEDDIEVALSLKLSEALLGCSKMVETPDGPKKIKIPPGVKAGTKIRLRGLGFTESSGKQHDLHAVVDIEIPKDLSSEQMKAVELLAESGL